MSDQVVASVQAPKPNGTTGFLRIVAVVNDSNGRVSEFRFEAEAGVTGFASLWVDHPSVNHRAILVPLDGAGGVLSTRAVPGGAGATRDAATGRVVIGGSLPRYELGWVAG